jgi:hypothetical protein
VVVEAVDEVDSPLRTRAARAFVEDVGSGIEPAASPVVSSEFIGITALQFAQEFVAGEHAHRRPDQRNAYARIDPAERGEIAGVFAVSREDLEVFPRDEVEVSEG